MATALQSNSTLTSLYLRSNRIGDAGAQHLATALQSNSSLTQLNLQHNEIENDISEIVIAESLTRNQDNHLKRQEMLMTLLFSYLFHS